MIAIDGRHLTSDKNLSCEVVIVGSGPAGATVAKALSDAGLLVVVVEEGHLATPSQMAPDSFTAMSTLYRDMGASLLQGPAPMPFVQGRVVGGTSVINGAISWRLPRDVHQAWVDADPALEEALPWDLLALAHDRVEADLSITPTDPAIAGRNNTLLAQGAEALGLAHRPIARNVKGCRGLARCLQGCPEGNKLSMDLSYLAWATDKGARVVSGVRVEHIDVDSGRATGIRGIAAGGGTLTVAASRAVVVAASAVQTPVLLWRSRIRQGPVGEGFMCHPGVSMVGRFTEPVVMWSGATQGHEVTGLRTEGLKFEALGLDRSMAAARYKGVGKALSLGIDDLAHWASWGAAVKARARGRVRPGWGGRARVRYSLTKGDLATLRRGLQVLGEMMLAAGAQKVTPGVHGWHAEVRDRAVMARFADEAPSSPRAYSPVVTHMFGTCRMGSDPQRSVVRPDFRHHAVDQLYVADSSVFPTNTGVNPQTSICALAWRCAAAITA